ncbi:unnamed protein product [Linum tenue]|uniref:DEAD-box ATP-dependent RNA helicase 39 n=1 Tax=Linum tenue TaxID=586396 RepID=A0AAV0IGD2_9ROSI|nr:unnamed protein product [Linum tenue]
MRRANRSYFLYRKLVGGVAQSSLSTQPIKRPPLWRPFSSGNEKSLVGAKSKKESAVLEKFRQRKLQGSLKTQQHDPGTGSNGDGKSDNALENGAAAAANAEAAEVVSSFAELGLREELIAAAEEMGVRVPDEIQCVGIPAILEGKSVVLSCDDGDDESAGGRTLAYLLPLIQLLRQKEVIPSSKKHPKAIVLCPTDELADEVFRGAAFVCDCIARTRPEAAKGSIGLLVGTPEEVLQQIEDGTIVVDDIRYLVVDEADAMLEVSYYRDQISKIIHPLQKPDILRIQTVLASSPITKMLSEDYTSLVKSIERENAGQVAAMLLEMDQEEVFDVLKLPGGLKRKVAEAMDSLSSNT